MEYTLHYTEEQLFRLIAERYAGDAYAVLASVRNRTGYGGRERTADAVVLSLWPSRGIWAAGFEIKSNYSDLRRELLKPEKAEEIARFMHHWWLVLADGEWPEKMELPVPATWGVMCPDAEGKKLVVRREAPLLEPQPWNSAFVCSLVREAARQITEEAVIARRVEEARKEGYARGLEDGESAEKARMSYRQHDLEETMKAVADFKAQSGIDDLSRWTGPRIGEAVAAVDRLIGYTHDSPGDKRPETVRELEKIGGALLRLASEVDRLLFNPVPEPAPDQGKE